MIALVGDLARRLAIANPRETDPLQGQGIVLIDEIDLHLHPSWQARVLPTLLKVFPNIQFIVTTHAPKVLGEMGDEVNVIHLEEDDGEIIVEQIEPLNGWDVNTILEEYMGTSSLHFETRRMIEEMYEHIHLGEYDKAEEIADRLERMTDAKNPAVVRGRVLIARGR